LDEWQLDFEWLRIRHFVKDQMGREDLPDLNGVLFLVGIQELGWLHNNFTKEQKQDLMHIAVCKLLSYDNYYKFLGRDEDGWPHYKLLRPVPKQGIGPQENLLKEKIIQYFAELESEIPQPNEN